LHASHRRHLRWCAEPVAHRLGDDDVAPTGLTAEPAREVDGVADDVVLATLAAADVRGVEPSRLLELARHFLRDVLREERGDLAPLAGLGRVTQRKRRDGA